MQNCEKIPVLAGVLFTITALVAFLLAAVHAITAPFITENLEKERIEARMAVLPEAAEFIDLSVHDMQTGVTAVFQGLKEKTPVGYCLQVTCEGYSGSIELLVGIDCLYKVQAVKILSMSETAGLGAKAQEESFLIQYKGKNAKEKLSVIKSGSVGYGEITAISGATVTSKAVTDGVNAAMEAVFALEEGAR